MFLGIRLHFSKCTKQLSRMITKRDRSTQVIRSLFFSLHLHFVCGIRSFLKFFKDVSVRRFVLIFFFRNNGLR